MPRVGQITRVRGLETFDTHFQALVLDGVDTSESPFAPPLPFQPARKLTDEGVVLVARLLVRRIVRHLQRRGRLPHQAQAGCDEPEPDEPPLALLSAAWVLTGEPDGRPSAARDRSRSDGGSSLIAATIRGEQRERIDDAHLPVRAVVRADVRRRSR